MYPRNLSIFPRPTLYPLISRHKITILSHSYFYPCYLHPFSLFSTLFYSNLLPNKIILFYIPYSYVYTSFPIPILPYLSHNNKKTYPRVSPFFTFKLYLIPVQLLLCYWLSNRFLPPLLKTGFGF